MTTTRVAEYEAIAEVLEIYLDAAKSDNGENMRPAFHDDATVFGYVGDELFAGPIAELFSWHDENGAATGLHARIASIDLIDTVATARVEIDDWTGYRFTDLFTLLKVDGEWKIMNKVFHLHSQRSDGGSA